MSVRDALGFLVLAGAACGCTLPDLHLVYPALAAQARLSGEVRSTVAYGEDGVPVILAASRYPFLRDTVTQSIRAAATPASCLGRKVEVTVTFTLLGCNADRHWSRAERVNETAWNVFAPMPYTIACGEEKIVRKFPFCFLKRPVGFCRRLSSDGPVCSTSAEATVALSSDASSVR